MIDDDDDRELSDDLAELRERLSGEMMPDDSELRRWRKALDYAITHYRLQEKAERRRLREAMQDIREGGA